MIPHFRIEQLLFGQLSNYINIKQKQTQNT